jgi:aldose 1-epimerase
VANEPQSGRQYTATYGRHRAVVVEVGGGLREYSVDGLAVLDGYAIDEMADGGRGQPLLPWPNRLADGRYEFQGQQHQLPIDEVARHNAIHGLTRWLNWRAAQPTQSEVRMALTLHPRPGYPFALELSIAYSLSDSGLMVRTTAHNVGKGALPFGAGQHPYLTVGTPKVDSAVLQLAARSRLEIDAERRLPTAKVLGVSGSEVDFREPHPIGSLAVDECYAELDRDAAGRASALLSDPGSGRQVGLWMDEHYRYLQVFSGDTLTPDRRRRGLAIEPMTCPPNAFRSAIDLIVLQPDESITLAWGIAALA